MSILGQELKRAIERALGWRPTDEDYQEQLKEVVAENEALRAQVAGLERDNKRLTGLLYGDNTGEQEVVDG